MAESDLASEIAPHLDRHLVFHLLEFLQEKQLYPDDKILKSKIDLLSKTNMVDYAMDIHKSLCHTDDVPQGWAIRRKLSGPILYWVHMEKVIVLRNSKEKVKRNLDFLVNSVGLPLDDIVDDIVRYPVLFGFSLEKRMIPRYKVMEALESMQVPKPKMRFPSVCNLSERIFLEKYIHSNAESSSVLLDIYHGGKVDN